MNEKNIPEDVKEFIFQCIESVAQWEGLLLLRAHPGKAYEVKEVASGLYIHPSLAAELLSQLASQGFIEAADEAGTVRYRYAPSSEIMQQKIDRAAEVYATHLKPMTHLIHNRPKIKLQKFADAFKLRKD